jgi:hypothetical protein
LLAHRCLTGKIYLPPPFVFTGGSDQRTELLLIADCLWSAHFEAPSYPIYRIFNIYPVYKVLSIYLLFKVWLIYHEALERLTSRASENFEAFMVFAPFPSQEITAKNSN